MIVKTQSNAVFGKSRVKPFSAGGKCLTTMGLPAVSIRRYKTVSKHQLSNVRNVDDVAQGDITINGRKLNCWLYRTSLNMEEAKYYVRVLAGDMPQGSTLYYMLSE